MDRIRASGIYHAHKQAEGLMRKAAGDAIKTYKIDPSIVGDIAGYPSRFDDDTFYVTTLVILDRERTDIQPDFPFVAIKAVYGYRSSENGIQQLFDASHVLNSIKSPSEAGIREWLETSGWPPYRITLQAPESSP